MAVRYGVLEFFPVTPAQANAAPNFINGLLEGYDVKVLSFEYTPSNDVEELAQNTFRMSIALDSTGPEAQTLLQTIKAEAESRGITVTKKKLVPNLFNEFKRTMLKWGFDPINRNELRSEFEEALLENRVMPGHLAELFRKHLNKIQIDNLGDFRKLLKSLRDIDYPDEPKETIQGYFLLDFSDYSAQMRYRWLQPGDFWTRRNEDDSEINQAWRDLPREERFRISLANRSTIYPSTSNGFRAVAFAENIPTRLKDSLVALVQSSTKVRYLGETLETALQNLTNPQQYRGLV